MTGSRRRWAWWGVALGVLAVLVMVGVYLIQWPAAPVSARGSAHRIPDFRHVFVLMMENAPPQLFQSRHMPYLRTLADRYAVDTAFYGVTHASLPNYVAAISGRTFDAHFDTPTQRFPGPTLANQLQAHGISWQAAMGGLPRPGFRGNWFPGSATALTSPPDALYAKKHDPFMFFPALQRATATHVVPLRILADELRRSGVPRFVWISPDLCQDMHGQPTSPRAVCPEVRRAAMEQRANAFLARWVPAIVHSAAFRSGPCVLFIAWDEQEGPESLTPAGIHQWLRPGPASPTLLGLAPVPLGGGQVPFIVVTNSGPHHLRVALWADVYSVLKTVEAAWGLPFLGHAADPAVPTLWPFFRAP
jgi:hypothetical protein